MQTPSKINLFLRVAGRRPDGYHELETLFYPLTDPADTVELDMTGRGMVSEERGVPCDRTNLCMKALYAFCEAAEIDPAPFTVTLKKRIPVTAGMGGGSSDAAAVLRLLREKYPEKQVPVAEIAAKIGADVPFFLQPEPAVATGIGENLTPVHGLPDRLPILIAAPGFPVSAKWAYQHRFPNPEQDSRLPELIDTLRARDYAAAAPLLRNDLAATVMEKFPLMNLLEDALNRTGACRVMVSGSGPTLFALYDSFNARDCAAKAFDLPNIRLIVPA